MLRMTAFFDWSAPLFWLGADALWLIAAIVFLVQGKGKVAIAFLFFAALSFLISSLHCFERYRTLLEQPKELIEFGTAAYFVIYDVLWTGSLIYSASCAVLIALRMGAIFRRNRELESLHAALAGQPSLPDQGAHAAE